MIGPFKTLPGLEEWLNDQPDPSSVVTAALIEYRSDHSPPDTEVIEGLVFERDRYGSMTHLVGPGKVILKDRCGAFQPITDGECTPQSYKTATEAKEALT